MYNMKNSIAIISLLMLMSVSCSNRQNTAPNVEDSLATEQVEESRPGYNIWDYKTSTDEMDDSKVQFAHLQSENAKDLGYVDESRMHIIIRHREDNGDQVFINVDYGTFDVDRRREEANIRVRFGKEEPISFKVRSLMGDDRSSVGLLKPSKFIEMAQESDTILIEAPFFRKSNQVFKFVSSKPLKWEN